MTERLRQAADTALSALYKAQGAMRAPLDDWKGVLERNALDLLTRQRHPLLMLDQRGAEFFKRGKDSTVMKAMLQQTLRYVESI